nr:coat protein [Umbelopsis ramanniana virus 8a]
MAKVFIKDSVNTAFAVGRDPVIKDGRFTVVNNTVVDVNQGNRHYHSDLSLTADFQVAGRKKRGNRGTLSTDYAGYNRKYITEDGNYDGVAALEEFAKVSAEKGMMKPEVYTQLSKYTQADSHEAFLYNMLISWYKAKLYSDSQGVDDVLKVKTSAYNDSHVVVALDQSFDDHTYELDLGYPVDQTTIERADWVLRNKELYWSRPYVLTYNASNPKQEVFYLLHTLGRNDVTALNFDIEIRGLNAKDLLLDPLNGRDYLPADYSDLDWSNHHLMWSWIVDYVKINRVEQAFASAFELLGALAYQPCPPTMEAAAWQEAEFCVVLADFSPTRGRLRTNLSGEAFKPYALAEEFLLSEAEAPGQFMASSALCNYYMWMGLYALLYNEARTRTEWRTVFSSVADELQVLYTAEARAACISVATGKEFSTCLTESCGMYIDTSRMETTTRLNRILDLDGTIGDQIEIKYMPAPVSGGILLGTFSEQLLATEHLTGTFQLPLISDEPTPMGHSDIMKTCLVYRLFGFDCTLREMYSQQEYQTWAAARECVPEPGVLGLTDDVPRIWKIVDASPREGRRNVLPTVYELLSNTHAIVQVQKPTVKFNEWRKRTQTLKPQIRFVNKKQAVTFKVNTPLRYNNTRMIARPVAQKAKQDFTKGSTSGPPVTPEVKRVIETDVTGAQSGVLEAEPADTAA